MPQRPLIALLTDFGVQDAYVASMKGVMAGIVPDAAVIDITHAVPPQDVHTGAFLLETCVDAFPPRTTYVCVVDPGVGTERRPLALRTPIGTFVGPDNGLFSYVLARYATSQPEPVPLPPTAAPLTVPPGLEARVIATRSLMRPEVSTTFHGRDIFAPVAARLAAGVPFDAVGSPTNQVQAFGIPRPQRLASGELAGHVIHVDGYGNLLTNLRPDDLPSAPRFTIGTATVQGLRTTYQGSTAPLVALTSSSGYVEIAAPNGSAALATGVGCWAPVTVSQG